jgi:hypothetical protein
MQFFYVKQDVLISLPHKQKKILGVSEIDVANGSIPLSRIYCGFIAWEHIGAQQQIGKMQSCLVHPSSTPNALTS